jgi:hypothetical protein
MNGESEQNIEYESIEKMFMTFHQCMLDNVIEYSETGYLDIDYDKHSVIASSYNLDIEIWK